MPDDDNKSFKSLPTTPRTCLSCGKEFKSTGPGNRICPRCHTKAERGGPKETRVVLGKNRPDD